MSHIQRLESLIRKVRRLISSPRTPIMRMTTLS